MPRYTAFVRLEALEKAGMDAERISSPYQLWNSELDDKDYAVYNTSGYGVQSEKYRQLEEDPSYVKIELRSGN